ncbi:hypothetical protein K435DRAFT_659469 [Dendrothele bispora CBS 962.96]|uniref:Large ribosomal subunit protein bL28c n=1 Tax=Dendrothele bispora (strain CBS 962.96) TaxID=1314807 RepID=A0A4S8MB29_DENBC|nr:hypothetical protein K435DRAFT_659469 [Dendrothele bispora CBS 962.96]
MHPTLSTLKALITSQPFKRSQLGLFQGKTKQYGNNVPFSKHKTRRTWLPNVQRKRLFSDALQRFVKVKLTTRALKTIKKKYTSIDNYVFSNSPSTIGHEGMRLRLMMRDAVATKPWPGETREVFEKRKEKEARKAEKKEATRERTAEVKRITRGKMPTLEDARRAREAAEESLRLSGCVFERSSVCQPSNHFMSSTAPESYRPGRILQYLKQRKETQKTLMGDKFLSLI